jgi:hypothetical protein
MYFSLEKTASGVSVSGVGGDTKFLKDIASHFKVTGDPAFWQRANQSLGPDGMSNIGYQVCVVNYPGYHPPQPKLDKHGDPFPGPSWNGCYCRGRNATRHKTRLEVLNISTGNPRLRRYRADIYISYFKILAEERGFEPPIRVNPV